MFFNGQSTRCHKYTAAPINCCSSGLYKLHYPEMFHYWLYLVKSQQGVSTKPVWLKREGAFIKYKLNHLSVIICHWRTSTNQISEPYNTLKPLLKSVRRRTSISKHLFHQEKPSVLSKPSVQQLFFGHKWHKCTAQSVGYSLTRLNVTYRNK